jgi:hypothetical protein
MKKIVFALLILISSLTFSQERRFEFESVDSRAESGWEVLPISGEVIFYEDKEKHTISIVTENHNYLMYVKSRQLFIRDYNFLYTLVDEDYNESSIRIILENRSWDYVDFYFYSDRPGEKYFRLCLKLCK